MKHKVIVGVVVVLFLTIAIENILPKSSAGTEINEHILQPPEVQWNKTYGGSGYDIIYCVKQTGDGGYIAGGQREEDTIAQAWLFKLDANGEQEWEITLPGIEGRQENRVEFVEQTDDGGYIACGVQGPAPFECDGFLWRINPDGITQWVSTYPYGVQEYGNLYCVHAAPDGGYIAVGNTEGTDGDYDGYLLKTDESGAVEWKHIYSNGNDFDMLCSLWPVEDGFILGGSTTIENRLDCWLIKTTEDGAVTWEQNYGGSENEAVLSRHCLPTPDGGVIIPGITYSYGAGKYDIWAVKTDGRGNAIWNETYGSDKEERVWGIDVTEDGGYIFCITTNYRGFSGSKGDIMLLRTDADGNGVWSTSYGGSKEERGYDVSKTDDGGYIVAGRTDSFGAGDSDGWLLKIAPDVDLTRPSLEILCPNPGWVYLFDLFGLPLLPGDESVVLGGLTFQVDTSCGAEGAVVTKVEYFIDGRNIATATEPPFSYTWAGAEPGIYHLKARAYNTWGGTDSQTRVLWKVV